MEWVAAQAAFHTAEAGNRLISDTPAENRDALLCVDEARKFNHCWEVINLLRNPDFSLQLVLMKPKPFTESE